MHKIKLEFTKNENFNKMGVMNMKIDEFDVAFKLITVLRLMYIVRNGILFLLFLSDFCNKSMNIYNK